VGRRQVGACAVGEPPDGANNALVLALPGYEGRRVVVFVGVRDGIDRQTGSVGGPVRRDIAKVNIVRLDKVGCETSLTEVNLDFFGTDRPLEVSAKKPLDVPHEVDCNTLLEETLEFGLDGSIIGEVYEVIDIETEGKMCRGGGVRGVIGVDDVSAEEAWVVCVLFEAESLQNGLDLHVPMSWAAAEAVQCPLQEPIFILFCVGITNGRFDNGDFVRRENTVAEGVLAVALSEFATLLNGHAHEEAHCVCPEDRRVFLGLRPNSVFVVA
jgi:hypothetical protein